MSLDNSVQRILTDLSEARQQFRHDGGGTNGGDMMESRVTKLETHMEYVRRDLDAIKDSQMKVLDRLGELPTRSDLSSWRWQWLATGLAIVTLTIGGITGGLALIARYAG